MISIGLLVVGGAPVDGRYYDGSTPLMMAAEKGHAEVVQRLLAAGADPNAVDVYGRTPLLRASAAPATGRGRQLVLRNLLAAGAEVGPLTAMTNKRARAAADQIEAAVQAAARVVRRAERTCAPPAAAE